MKRVTGRRRSSCASELNSGGASDAGVRCYADEVVAVQSAGGAILLSFWLKQLINDRFIFYSASIRHFLLFLQIHSITVTVPFDWTVVV